MTLTHFSNCFSCSFSTAAACLALLAFILTFYGWIACRVSKKAVLQTQPFTLLDAIVASTLGLWFLSVIISSFGKDQLITLPIILLNGAIYFFLVTGIISLLLLRRLSPIQFFGLAPTHPGKIIKTALLWLLASYPLIMVAQGVVQTLFSTDNDTQAVVLYFLKHPGWQDRLGIIIMAVIIAPIAEEFLFRGYLYGVLRRFTGRIPAIIVTSLLFSAIHLHLPSMLGLGLLAVSLCLLYERTGSLWANICVHATFNTLSIVMLLIFQKAIL